MEAGLPSDVNLEARPPSKVLKIEVVKPGFINFFLGSEYFGNIIREIGNHFGENKNLEGQKIIIEYTDPNPFKEFHIGHVYTNTVGESLSRIFEENGATVWRGDYFGDVEEAILTQTKIHGWRVRATKNSFLSKVLGSAKGVIVPHQLVKAVGDIMIISKAAVPSYSEEEASAEETVEA